MAEPPRNLDPYAYGARGYYGASGRQLMVPPAPKIEKKEEPSPLLAKLKIPIIIIFIILGVFYYFEWIGWEIVVGAVAIIAVIYLVTARWSVRVKGGTGGEVEYHLPDVNEQIKKIINLFAVERHWRLEFDWQCKVTGDPQYGMTANSPGTLYYLFKVGNQREAGFRWLIVKQSPIHFEQKGLGIVDILPYIDKPTESEHLTWFGAFKYPKGERISYYAVRTRPVVGIVKENDLPSIEEDTAEGEEEM